MNFNDYTVHKTEHCQQVNGHMKSKVNKLTYQTKNYRFNFWYRFLFCIFYLYFDHFLSKLTSLSQIFLHTIQHRYTVNTFCNLVLCVKELNVRRTRLNIINITSIDHLYLLKTFLPLYRNGFFLLGFLIISQR